MRRNDRKAKESRNRPFLTLTWLICNERRLIPQLPFVFVFVLVLRVFVSPWAAVCAQPIQHLDMPVDIC